MRQNYGLYGLVDIVVKKAEQRFISDIILPVLATVVLICFVHDSLQSRVTPSSLVSQLAKFPDDILQDLVKV